MATRVPSVLMQKKLQALLEKCCEMEADLILALATLEILRKGRKPRRPRKSPAESA